MMKNFLIILGLSTLFAVGLGSCSGCVKKVSKGITEVGISAVEGAAEAVDEHGERIAEKTANAAGKLAVGAGRSIDKQLNEHATHVASVAGRTSVQTIDGFTDGFSNEVKQHYTELPYTEQFVSGVSLAYFAKYNTGTIIDAYFLIPQKGYYVSKFECVNNAGKVFLTKNIDIDRTIDNEDIKYTLVSFALNAEEEIEFQDLQNIKIVVSEK